ncbi:hypothetical protein [Kitasatospora sp. NPDC091207]|uniref:hypothetical protein n=1 Tax=Kitasatospora sp. NPDC091207 TaxID=3364083 RepID=UPI00380256E9
MTTVRADAYAPAATLPGLLQRGRGLGARMAAEDPSAAAALVYGCVRWDWRWDRRADDRARYLARLVRDLELPVEPVAELLGGGGEASGRAARVLGLLAPGGPAPAGHAPAAGAGAGPVGAGCPARPGGRPDDPGARGEAAELVAALERDWVERRWCGPLDTARGLARFGPEAKDAVSLLRRFWLWTPHSSERAGYLEALAAIDPTGLDAVYVECLWDCEDDARLLGIAHAPDGPDVRARLAYLRDDAVEERGVRAAAGARLAALTR